jgi:hypothetical protein
MEEKLYVIRKFVMAKSAKDAILKEKKGDVDDVWLDEDFKKSEIDKGCLGFKTK